jgi:hypothetical protein
MRQGGVRAVQQAVDIDAEHLLPRPHRGRHRGRRQPDEPSSVGPPVERAADPGAGTAVYTLVTAEHG